MSSNTLQTKTKTFDFSHRELLEMPLIKENDYCDIFLDHNSLTTIDNIPSSCLKLSVSNNKISNIHSITQLNPQDNLHLIFLDLSLNRLISLIGIDKLTTVSFLNLSHNYISDDQLTHLTPLNNLKQLNLSNNNLKNGTIAKIIADMKSIERVNLNNNNIESLTFTSANYSLIQLDIDSNKLISLSFSKNCLNSLTHLSINNNKLNLVSPITNLPQLSYISIESNSIQNISLHLLMKLKCVKLNNNAIQKYAALNSSVEIIEVANNNLSEFYLSNTNNCLKSLLLNNNKLEQIAIDDNNNSNQTIEFIDLANNSFKQVSFLNCLPKLIRVNFAFNQLNNLNEVLRVLKELKSLRELNLIENLFNRGVYNLDLIYFTYNSINDYYKNAKEKPKSKVSLEDYRWFIIVNLNQITFLDIIAITQQEKDSAYMKMNKSKEKARKKSKAKEEEEFGSDYVPAKTLSNNQSKRYLMTQQEKDKPIMLKNQLSQKQMRINETDQNKNVNNPQLKIKNEIMSKLIDIFINFKDENGFIYYKQLVHIFNELNVLYEVTRYTTNILSDVKNTIKSSLIPFKIHIKELIKIIGQKQYEPMHILIKNNIKQSKTIETNKGHSQSTNNSNRTTALTTLAKEDIGIISSYRSKPKPNRNAIPKSARRLISKTSKPVQSPFLSLYRQDSMGYHQITKVHIPCKENKCFNILFQSDTELSSPPDLSNIEFIINFLFFINYINIIIKYKDIANSYIIPITKEEKEYKFLKTFISNYNISCSFTLRKWYNHLYYSQVFLNWNSIDFLFEFSPIFFFSYYNDIIDNFINNKYSLNDSYLMIEENPLNLLSKRNTKQIVMLVNIQSNIRNDIGDESSKLMNLIFNEDDSQFYFKNPFEWINANSISINNNNCILVPVYIMTFD